jgi:hypothetical protein
MLKNEDPQWNDTATLFGTHTTTLAEGGCHDGGALRIVLRTLADGQTGLQPVCPFNHSDSRNDYDM